MHDELDGAPAARRRVEAEARDRALNALDRLALVAGRARHLKSTKTPSPREANMGAASKPAP
jgi:hypothetical protein